MESRLPDLWQAFDRPLMTLGSLRPLLRQLDDMFSEVSTLAPEYQAFVPPLDVDEEGDRLLLSFDVPGVDKDQIDIEVQGNQLMVRGERRDDRQQKRRGGTMVERRYGSFMRSVTLPSDVNPDEIEATFENGVLRIALPKSDGMKAHKIKIGERQGQKALGNGGETSSRGKQSSGQKSAEKRSPVESSKEFRPTH